VDEKGKACGQEDRTRLCEVVVPWHTAIEEGYRGEIGPQKVEWRECERGRGREIAVVPRVDAENYQNGDSPVRRWTSVRYVGRVSKAHTRRPLR
jgi:hypothetical protein